MWRTPCWEVQGQNTACKEKAGRGYQLLLGRSCASTCRQALVCINGFVAPRGMAQEIRLVCCLMHRLVATKALRRFSAAHPGVHGHQSTS